MKNLLRIWKSDYTLSYLRVPWLKKDLRSKIKGKRKLLKSDHIKNGQLNFNRYQLPSFYMPRFFDGGNTSNMAWMFAITFEEGSVFLKKSEVLLKLVCWCYMLRK